MTGCLVSMSVGALIATGILALYEYPHDVSALFAVLLALWAIVSELSAMRKEAQP